MKRAFDFSVAAAGLLFALPLLAVVILAIRRESPGPAIFKQDRIGKDGRTFRCYKLRTMFIGTENVPTHMASRSAITPLGQKLRSTKLDELPQLFNIVRGEMSFVGPRPCLPSQAQLVEERRRLGVLDLLPGITGPAQVEGIDMSDPVNLARKDAEYIGRASVAYDLALIWRTVVGGEGQGDRVRN